MGRMIGCDLSVIGQVLDRQHLRADNHLAVNVIRFGEFEMDVARKELRRDGRLVRLQPQAWCVLAELVANAGAVVGREQFRRALWPDGRHVDFDRGLNTAMRKLRSALGDSADHPRYVRTVAGGGYCFIAPIEHVATTHEATDAARFPERTAARVALAFVAAAALALSVVSTWSPRRDVVNVRAADTDERSQFTVQALQVLVGRLDPARLRVTANPSIGADSCHEMVVSTAPSRTTIRLLDVCRNEQLWAADDDGSSSNSSATRLLRSAGAAVVDQLLNGDRDARLAAATTNGAALDLYRRGRRTVAGDGREDLSLAVEAFETAVDLDNDFAPAWAALARARATRALGDGWSVTEIQTAERESQRALFLDPGLADAHIAEGQIHFARRHFAPAEAALRRAHALGAATGSDLVWLARVLNADRRPREALAVVEQAIALEPRIAALHAWRGLLLHALRRYDEELRSLQQAVVLG